MPCFMQCEPEENSDELFYVCVMPEFTIYGHTIDKHTKKHYPEDWPWTQEMRRSGREWGCWHSEVCPDGEIGSHDMRAIALIPQDFYGWAEENGWPDLSHLGITFNAPAASVSVINADNTVTEVWNSIDGDLDNR